MAIQDPKPDRAYWFVRVTDGEIQWLAYQRYADGSATTASEASETIWEADEFAWRMALDQIQGDGFVSRDDALRSGLIRRDDRPPTILQNGYGKPELDCGSGP